MSSIQPPSPSQSVSLSNNNQSGGTNNTLIIIIVSCIGGFLVVLAAVCTIVPLLRRRVARRASREIEQHSPSPTSHGHGRALSEAGAPLLSPRSRHHPHDPSEHSIIYTHAAQESFDSHSPRMPEMQIGYGDPGPSNSAIVAERPTSPSITSHENGDPALVNPWRAYAGLFRASSPPSTSPASSSHQPHAPLRRARTRIHAPMPSLPEDGVPSPTDPAAAADHDHPSWLHIPSAEPLINAFRRSVAASTSSRATSINSSLAAANAFPTPARSSDALTFISAASEGHTPPANEQVPPVEPRDIPARLRPSEPARVAYLVPGPMVGGGPGSRAASLLSASAQTGSRSELSVYTDARSNFDVSELGERR